MAIIGLIVGTISAALGRREEREAFNRMAFNRISSLLKCSPDEWNEEFYWTHRADRVREVLKKHGRVLILGPAGVCKSRTAIEVLRAIFREDRAVGKALVIVLSKKDISELNRLPVPKWCLKGYDLVVLLLDDLETYVRILRVRELIRRFETAVKKVWVVATCRTEVLEQIEEDPEVSGLFGAGPEARRELRVEMSLYTIEEGREIARLAGKEFRAEEFDGTGASIILGTHRKKEHYDKLAREGRVAELDVLHALKLLRLSGIPFPRVELVRLVWTRIFGHPEGEWPICYSRVRELGFFLPLPPPPSEPEVLLMPDVFVRQVITLYPPPGVSPLDHMARLACLLEEAEAWDELFSLGVALGLRGHYDEALRCFDAVIRGMPEPPAEAYFSRGLAWRHKGDYDRAIQDYTKAIELKPDYAEAYNNRGITWRHKGDYDRALEDFEVAWSLRHKLPDKGALIPLNALSAILEASARRPREPELAEALATWLGRAEEVYDLLPEEGKRLVDKLKEELSRRSHREPGVEER